MTTDGNNPNLAAFLEELRGAADYQLSLSHYHHLPAELGRFAAPRQPLAAPVELALRRLGISQLYAHQAQALDLLQEGRHILVATPTASGKTLIYNVPVLTALLQEQQARALYLFPLKALEQDQLKTLMEWQRALPDQTFQAAIYDGDTPAEVRKHLRRQPPHILLTNPDMLHLGLLPYHEAWRQFFSELKFIVIDEVHTYRGIMGSHMAQVLRRLTRICRLYGSTPQYILASATIANPAELAAKLTGAEVAVIADSGAPLAGRHFVFYNPETSAAVLAARLFVQALRHGLATICFTQARKLTELMHLWALRQAPHLKRLISSYRAGFLPEERREIEAKLTSGKMLGVISTSALEMGIDIGGLDVCILVGYPGTMVTTWQRSGRVGRWGQDSLVILVAQPDALDQYFMNHPEEFFSRQFEAAVLDPHNPYVLKAHLPCAAQELPLSRQQETVYDLEACRELIIELEKERQLLRAVASETWYASSRFPQKEVNIRGVGQSFAIFQTGRKRPIGSIDGHRAFTECHPGAIYLHKATSYLVEKLDLERRNILVQPVAPDYFTRIQSEKETEILEEFSSRALPQGTVHLGRLKVTQRLVAYEKRRLVGQELLGVIPLDLPPQIFETVGMWLQIPDEIKQAVSRENLHFMGGIHALEHALISMFPLYALADRYDIGGISTPLHPQLQQAAVFIYDGYPGGVGLAAKAYEMMELLLGKTRDLIAACTCEDGCPSCIHSPKCGSGNKPLDKAAALQVATGLLTQGTAVSQPAASAFQVAEAKPVPREPVLTVPGLEPYRIAVLDIETQLSAEEVGGWHHCHLMKLAVAVVADLSRQQYEVYFEDQAAALCQRLQEVDLVVGFNLKKFDYRVLQPYTEIPLKHLPTLDILEEIQHYLGHKLSLEHLAAKTLNEGKSGDGLLALRLFREGRWEELIAYCRKDVELTARLFAHGLQEGYLLYTHRQGALVRLPVDWTLARLLPPSH
ncbi:MAG: DEAD/DEAH box helicase [Desulfobacca sp.]|uniref:DEAD/DEAH box helicase n=1 Tax=Desulfobacca sp. TaxID=2067990 RepID=UPI00404B5E51